MFYYFCVYIRCEFLCTSPKIWKLHYFLCYISTVKEVQHSPASFEAVGSTKPKTSYSDNRYQGSYQLLSVLSFEFSFKLVKNGCLMISMSAGYSSQRHYIKFYKEHKIKFIIHLIHCNYIRAQQQQIGTLKPGDLLGGEVK